MTVWQNQAPSIPLHSAHQMYHRPELERPTKDLQVQSPGTQLTRIYDGLALFIYGLEGGKRSLEGPSTFKKEKITF